MAEVKHKIELAQLKRAADAIKTLCGKHEHRLLSVPVPVQRENAWIPAVLLDHYIQETESDILENVQYAIAFAVLLNEIVMHWSWMKSVDTLVTHSEVTVMNVPNPPFLTRAPLDFIPNCLNDVELSLLIARELGMLSSLREDSAQLISGNIENLYTDLNIIEDIQLQQAYMTIVVNAHYHSGLYIHEAYKELRRFRLILQSASGVKYLTPKGIRDAEAIVADVGRWHDFRETDTEGQSLSGSAFFTLSDADILKRLRNLTPDSFESLCQRLLLKSGIHDVKVTGRSGDDGIDGQGIIRLEGLTSIHVVFQAKRYRGNVGVSAIRDFRGAMDGRASTGFLITTGSFTNQARIEAERAGATKIDLIDGTALVKLLKKHGIDLE